MSNNQIDVSIIIPAYNEEENLTRLFKSFENQKTKLKYEIILVDNESTDKTTSIAKQFDVIIISEKQGSNISTIRNMGAKIAKGDVLAFIDSDCEAGEDWIEKGFSTINSKKDIGITGSLYSLPEKTTIMQRAWDSVRDNTQKEVNFVTSGNMFVKRKIFEEMGGFSSSLETGEDYDLCLRVSQKYLVINNPKIVVIHFGGSANLIQRFKKELWYGKNMIDIVKKDFFYKIFWLSIIHALMVSVSLVLLIFNYINILFGIVLFLFIPSMISMIKCFNVKNFKYLHILIPTYFVYFTARFIALLLK